MKTIALTTGFILTLIQGQFVYSQTHKPAYAGREEYIEVEKMSNFMSLTLAKGACGTYSRMTATTQSIMAPGDPDLRPQLTKIKMPVAIFHGVKDKLCDFAQAERLHKEIKGSYLVRFEKSGHGLFLEEMDKFNAELEKFARK
jgi:pimeloyl-ACP methyl ester carboxylesterase